MMPMDLEKIELALVECMRTDGSIDSIAYGRAIAMMYHGPDLLRLVRAMRFMQDTGAWVAPSGISVPPKDWRPRTRTGWDFDGISICDDFATPLAAIEAAMAAESK